MSDKITEIVFVDADTYVALYIDGKLDFWSDHYDIDFAYGLELGAKHPRHSITEKEVDFEWLDSVNGEMPKNLEDVKFQEYEK